MTSQGVADALARLAAELGGCSTSSGCPGAPRLAMTAATTPAPQQPFGCAIGVLRGASRSLAVAPARSEPP